MPYAELEVTVQRAPGRGHTIDVRFRAEPGDLDRDLATNIPVAIDKARLLTSSLDPQQYGAALSETVFADQRLREALISARASADARDYPLRIRLRLDPADPELHGIRWETVFDDQGVAIARSERFLLSRYLDSADMTRFKTPARPDVTALIVVASPANLAQFNLAPFDTNAEATRVRQALADIPAATLVTGASAGPVTLTAIVDALRFSYSILYLVCHGTMVKGNPYLALENDEGEVEWVLGDELAERIRDLGGDRRPALVVLASCQSVGVGQDSDVPAALAPQLARAGVAAVVGMQGNAPRAMVARLMPRFFEQLVEDGQVDRALAAARTGLRPDDPWWMPVLFLRARDGRIWHEAPSVAPAEQPRAPAPTRPRPALALWLAGAAGLLAVAAIAGAALLWQRPSQALALPTAAVLPTREPTTPPAPTLQPSPTLAPSPTPMPTVAPVAEGNQMVLIADLEQQGQQGLDYTRDLFEDLQQNIEAIPFSTIELRRLRRVITSEQEARAAAEAAGAAVVVWGRSTDDRIDLQVQAGDLRRFPRIPPQLGATTVRRTSTIPLRLSTTGEGLPSPALAVLTVFNVLHTAAGDNFAVLRLATIQDRLQGGTPAEAVGQSSAVRVYQFIISYYVEPSRAVAALTQGLTDDPDNPLLYVYRAISHQRLGDLQAAAEDAAAAGSLVPDWPTSISMLAAISGGAFDLPRARDELGRWIDVRPDDWLAYSYRAGVSYLLGDLVTARADVERAIALSPQTALPYSYGIVIALREGRVGEAQELTAEVRRRFSGQRGFDSSFYRGTFGSESPILLAVSTFELLLGGQFGRAAETSERALAMLQAIPAPILAADLHFMRGFAECSTGDHAAAAESYSRALEQTPDFALLHLLRAEARQNLGDGPGALDDLNAAATSPQAEQLAPTIQAAVAGKLSCRTVLP